MRKQTGKQILSGKQNFALRGHRDDSQHYISVSPGNFQALLHIRVDSGDTKLQKHFETAKKNATYRSKTIQNKMTIQKKPMEIAGNQIRGKIVSEINENSLPIYSVLGDEATDCGSAEQMPIF